MALPIISSDAAVILQNTGLDSLSIGHGPVQFSYTSLINSVKNIQIYHYRALMLLCEHLRSFPVRVDTCFLSSCMWCVVLV